MKQAIVYPLGLREDPRVSILPRHIPSAKNEILTMSDGGQMFYTKKRIAIIIIVIIVVTAAIAKQYKII